MASKKQKLERLQQIREQAASSALNPKHADMKTLANLVEEAAQLGMELGETKGKGA